MSETDGEKPNSPPAPRIIREVPKPIEYLSRGIVSKGRKESIVFDLAAGESPFGIIPAYERILTRLVSSGAYTIASSVYGGGVTEEPAIRFLRRWHGIGDKPYIVLDPRGSDGILKSIILELILDPHRRPSRVVGIGPTYPHIVNFAKMYGSNNDGSPVLPYESIAYPLEEKRPYRETLQFAERILGKRPREEDTEYTKKLALSRDTTRGEKPKIVYICNPSTPTGEIALGSQIESIVLASIRNNIDLVIIDEAFLYVMKYSAVPLTEEAENLIVLGSLSKTVGMSGQRIGWAVMSEGIGRIYDRLRLIYDMPGPLKLIANEILRRGVLTPRIRQLRRATSAVKSRLLQALEARKIEYFPTSLNVPILFIDGKRQDFYQRLIDRGVITAPGSGFAETHPDLKEMGQAANRYVRVRIPRYVRDIQEIADRLADAAFGN